MVAIIAYGGMFYQFADGDHGQKLRQLEESSGVHIYDWEDANSLMDLESSDTNCRTRSGDII